MAVDPFQKYPGPLSSQHQAWASCAFVYAGKCVHRCMCCTEVCVRTCAHMSAHVRVWWEQGPAFLGVSSHGWLLSSQTSPDTFQESVRTGSWLTSCKGGLPWVRLGQTASLRWSPGAATPSGPE